MNHLTQPGDWPADAPPYHSKEGWEFEKKLALEKIKEQLKKPKLTYSCLTRMRTSCVWAIDWAIAYDLTDEYLRYCKILSRIEKSMWMFPASNRMIA